VLTKLFAGLELIVPQVAGVQEQQNFKKICERMINLYQENRTLNALLDNERKERKEIQPQIAEVASLKKQLSMLEN